MYIMEDPANKLAANTNRRKKRLQRLGLVQRVAELFQRLLVLLQ